MRNVSYTTLTIFFLRSTIEYLGHACRKTNLMIDYKKKVVKVVQKTLLIENFDIPLLGFNEKILTDN
jgi:hypothetical protein